MFDSAALLKNRWQSTENWATSAHKQDTQMSTWLKPWQLSALRKKTLLYKLIIFTIFDTNLSHIDLWHLVTLFSMSTGWYRMPRNTMVSSKGPTTNKASCRADNKN